MVSALTLALLVVSGQGWRASTAPGPASAAHAKIADNCDACHMPFKGLPNEKCLACHTELKKFHATVAAQKCNSCHVEHKGEQAELTRPEVRQSFNHELTGFTLIGAHQKVACAACHRKPIAQIKETCASCHTGPHQGALGTTCAACHQSQTWKPALHLLSQHKLSMEGGHAKVTKCASCHAKGANLSQTVQCASCHAVAHGGTTAACEGCHEVKAWTPAKFDHAFCTCQLPQKHQTVGCLGCHQDWNFTKTPTLCSGCHENERKHEPLGECSLCHSAVSWTKNQFNHNKTSRPVRTATCPIASASCASIMIEPAGRCADGTSWLGARAVTPHSAGWAWSTSAGTATRVTPRAAKRRFPRRTPSVPSTARAATRRCGNGSGAAQRSAITSRSSFSSIARS